MLRCVPETLKHLGRGGGLPRNSVGVSERRGIYRAPREPSGLFEFGNGFFEHPLLFVGVPKYQMRRRETQIHLDRIATLLNGLIELPGEVVPRAYPGVDNVGKRIEFPCVLR